MHFLGFLLENYSVSTCETLPNKSQDFLDGRRNGSGWSRGCRSASVDCPADWTWPAFHFQRKLSWKSSQVQKVCHFFEASGVHRRGGEKRMQINFGSSLIQKARLKLFSLNLTSKMLNFVIPFLKYSDPFTLVHCILKARFSSGLDNLCLDFLPYYIPLF